MPTTLVSTNAAGPSIERSTCDSAAKLTMARGRCSREQPADQRAVADVAPHEHVTRVVATVASEFARLPA